MPAAQLLCSIIEQGLNSIIDLDPNSVAKLQRLEDNSLEVELAELAIPLQFKFTGTQILVCSEQDSESDCSIQCDVKTLAELQDSSQLTQMIKADRLVLKGDLQVAQGFSDILKQLNIDWEEVISRYAGDVIAHKLVKVLKKAGTEAASFKAEFERLAGEYLIEEKQMSPHPIQLVNYTDSVSDLRGDCARLEVRIQKLEQLNKD